MQPSEELKYNYIMEKDGLTYEFENYPLDNTFIFKEIKLLNPEAEPKITDYSLWNNDGDFTNESFRGNKLFLIIHDVKKMGISDKKINEFINKVKILENGINYWVETIIVTSSDEKSIKDFNKRFDINLRTVYGDATVLKTIIRSNPGFFLMRNGRVRGKWHFNSFPEPKEILKGVNISL